MRRYALQSMLDHGAFLLFSQLSTGLRSTDVEIGLAPEGWWSMMMNLHYFPPVSLPAAAGNSVELVQKS